MNNKNNVTDPASTAPKHEAAAKSQHTTAEPVHKVGHAAPEATHKAEKAHAAGDAMKTGEKPKK